MVRRSHSPKTLRSTAARRRSRTSCSRAGLRRRRTSRRCRPLSSLFDWLPDDTLYRGAPGEGWVSAAVAVPSQPAATIVRVSAPVSAARVARVREGWLPDISTSRLVEAGVCAGSSATTHAEAQRMRRWRRRRPGVDSAARYPRARSLPLPSPSSRCYRGPAGPCSLEPALVSPTPVRQPRVLALVSPSS